MIVFENEGSLLEAMKNLNLNRDLAEGKTDHATDVTYKCSIPGLYSLVLEFSSVAEQEKWVQSQRGIEAVCKHKMEDK